MPFSKRKCHSSPGTRGRYLWVAVGVGGYLSGHVGTISSLFLPFLENDWIGLNFVECTAQLRTF